MTSEARRYRDEVLAQMRRDEETDRLKHRGFLGGPGGVGAKPERVSVSKKASISKWKGAGMVGSMMDRGRSWTGSKTSAHLDRSGGSRRSRRGSQEEDREQIHTTTTTDSQLSPVIIDGLPTSLRPGHDPRLSSPTRTPAPTPTTSTIRTEGKPTRSRPYSETFVGSVRSSNPSFLVTCQPRTTHPPSLLPGSPSLAQTTFDPTGSRTQPRSPSPNTVSLNSPCSETIDDPFVPPQSPPTEGDQHDHTRASALSATRLTSLLHPLTLQPGSRSASRSSRSRSWLGIGTSPKEVRATRPGWFAGRCDASDSDPSVKMRSPSTIGPNRSAQVSLPPTPIDRTVALWSPTPTVPVGDKSCLYSPPTDRGSSSPASTQDPDDATAVVGKSLDASNEAAPPPTPGVHGLALAISESSHTVVLPRPVSCHLPPNMSISIQCDALINELTEAASTDLPATVTPSSSIPDHVYAAPLVPSPVVSQRALFPSSPVANISPLVPRQRRLSHPDELAAKLEEDLSFQTPPPPLLLQRASSPVRSTSSSTLHEEGVEEETLAPPTATEVTAPTFKRPAKSKARPSRSSIILAVKERLSPALDAAGEFGASTESRRASRLLSKLVHGAERREEDADTSVGILVSKNGGGNAVKRVSNGDWGVLMHAAAEVRTYGRGEERGVERESRILKWRRESVGPGE